ncbi:hypothetical protein GCM10009037_06600 [Halarchaeum grantii]|uniref:DUF8135 domain-containing protein n=1 Tax=Halarchaeum grantii TaxID=1193105 RepID=A0A830EZM7_9EURY|nr:hypothetical protein [Halarchaeum grantii]GGL25640.1 hypothetical protein GCM10009037_06600 [Halarchaeum grantii]
MSDGEDDAADDEPAGPDDRDEPTERDRSAGPDERADVETPSGRPSPEVPASGDDAAEGIDDADLGAPLADDADEPVEGSPFEEMDVDADAVEAADVFAAAEETADMDVAPDTADASASGAEGDVRVISDRTCHSCEFFADPPDLACTHEGTEIRRVVDTDHYEVVNCPMVLDDVDIVEEF